MLTKKPQGSPLPKPEEFHKCGIIMMHQSSSLEQQNEKLWLNGNTSWDLVKIQF